MIRFGKDIEEAARRIRASLTRQAADKTRAGQVAAEADKLRAGGWRPPVRAVEPGPTLAHAQAAIEAGFARDAAIEAEAARRLAVRDAQLAQADGRGGALPLPPRLPDRRVPAAPDNAAADPLAGWPASRPILDRIVWRNDAVGKGAYGADRNRNGVIEPHEGIDILAPAGTSVYSPIDGTVTHIGWPYDSEVKEPDGLRTIQVAGPDGHRFELLYVAPVDGLAKGKEILAGDAIGTVQNWQTTRDKRTGKTTAESKRVKDHVHLYVYDKDGRRTDPTPWFEKWRDQTEHWRRMKRIEDRR